MKGRINLTRIAGLASAAIPAAPGKAPDRFRVWRAGQNPGDYGSLEFSAKAAAAVMAEFNRRGNAGAIDIEHATNPKANPALDPAKPPPGGGYYSLELVKGAGGLELWATNVRWSDYARNEIETGSRCYVSPDWDMTPDTREPVRLNKLSLVLEPGTYGINLLASASASRGSKTMNEIDKLRAAYAAMIAMSESSDPEIKSAAQALCEKLSTQASTLGIDLSADPAEDPAAESVADPVIAEAGPTPAKAPAMARAMASRSLSLADVQAVIREENAKQAFLSANAARPGMTAALMSVLASKSLKDAREIVGTLAPLPVAGPAGKVAGAPLNATAGAGAVDGTTGTTVDDALTPEEAWDIERMRKQLGVSVESVTASRKAAESGTAGVLSYERIRQMKVDSIAATAAKVAASK